MTNTQPSPYSYEDAVSECMYRWSDHPARPLTELEVFLGFILNKTGAQTHRQRDYSIKLKDEFERIATTITCQLRSASRGDPNNPKSTIETLTLCLAAVHVGGEGEKQGDFRGQGREGGRYRETVGMQSFRVVAACAFMRELGTMSSTSVGVGGGQSQSRIQSGGFVGTRSGGGGRGVVNELRYGGAGY